MSQTHPVAFAREKFAALTPKAFKETLDAMKVDIKEYAIDCPGKKLLLLLAEKDPAALVTFIFAAKHTLKLHQPIDSVTLRVMAGNSDEPVYQQLCDELKESGNDKTPHHVDNHPQTDDMSRFHRRQFMFGTILSALGATTTVAPWVKPTPLSVEGCATVSGCGAGSAVIGVKTIAKTQDALSMKLIIEALNPLVETSMGIDQTQPRIDVFRASATKVRALLRA